MSTNINDKLYIWVDGKKYDLTEFSENHPGGKYVLDEFQNKDATLFYYSTHKNKLINKIFKPIEEVNNVSQHIVNGRNTNIIYKFSKEYEELTKHVYKLLNNNPYAPTLWYIRACIIIISVCICYYLEMFYFKEIRMIAIFRCMHGLFAAFAGLCVLHDATHGSVSKYHWINRIFSYIGNDLISGQASQHWRIHHNILHHPYCNNSTVDPDINFGNTIITQHHYANFNQKIKCYHKYQHRYIFPLLPFQIFPLLRHTYSFYQLLVLKSVDSYKIPKRAQFETKINVVLKLIFLIHHYIIPFFVYTQQNKFGYLISILLIHLTNIFATSYLGFFFLISHFFDGTKAYNNNNQNVKYKNTNTKIIELDWAKSQIESSSNVGGNILSFLNGGLNYQIEHHLFPRVNSMHLPKLLNLVETFAKQNNFKYTHFNTIGENVMSTVKWLDIKNWLNKEI